MYVIHYCQVIMVCVVYYIIVCYIYIAKSWFTIVYVFRIYKVEIVLAY